LFRKINEKKFAVNGSGTSSKLNNKSIREFRSFDTSGDKEKTIIVKINEIIIKMKNVANVALTIRLFR